MAEEKVEISTVSGDKFVLSEAAANQSKTIRGLIEDVGTDDSIPLTNKETKKKEPRISIPLTNKEIEKEELSICVRYLTQIVENPAILHSSPEGNEKLSSKAIEITEWEKELIGTDNALIFRVINASNHLDIPMLLDVTTTIVANMIKGKSTEEIRNEFKIKNTLSPEEETKIRSENEWAEER